MEDIIMRSLVKAAANFREASSNDGMMSNRVERETSPPKETRSELNCTTASSINFI
jgi:hypothetical protein